jgi:hypothetical protein
MEILDFEKPIDFLQQGVNGIIVVICTLTIWKNSLIGKMTNGRAFLVD